MLPILKLQTDSREYDILFDAAIASAHAAGASCELGVREGGGSELIMRASAMAGSRRVHIAVDPWGNIPYRAGSEIVQWYPDDMRRRATKNLYDVADSIGADLIVFPFCDTDFFKHFPEGVPFYRGGHPEPINTYSLVHVDGPHALEPVVEEMDYFLPRISQGGYIVFDDIYLYDHASIEPIIFSWGYERMDDVTRPHQVKASYRRKGNY